MALISSVVRHNQGIQGNHANQGSDNRHRFGNLRQRKSLLLQTIDHKPLPAMLTGQAVANEGVGGRSIEKCVI